MSASIPIPLPAPWRLAHTAEALALPTAPASMPAAPHFWTAHSHLKEHHDTPANSTVASITHGHARRVSRQFDLDLSFVHEDRALGEAEQPSARNPDPSKPTSWPPRPELNLVSRSAARWLSENEVPRRACSTDAGPSTGGASRREIMRSPAAAKLFPDFSQVAFAVSSVREGLGSGRAGIERPPRESVSGTYFFKRVESKPSVQAKVTAVFKPADEEPSDGVSPCGSPMSIGSSPRHPRLGAAPCASPDWQDSSHSARMLAAGFRHGEGAFKEVAAYILDHDNAAKVPQTAIAELKQMDSETQQLRTKMGAFQVYVPNVGDADDWGPGIFPVEDIHRIAVLDIRILNFDRHGGNILVTRGDDGRYGLVPIDHAFTLPEHIKAVPWAVWMDWPAAKERVSKETRAYVAGLEPDIEARVLQEELAGKIRPTSARTLKIATHLLQKGVAEDLTLYDIGLLIYAREGDTRIDVRSELEKIVDEAVESSKQRQSHIGDDLEDLAASTFFPFEGASPACSPIARSGDDHVEDYIVKYACRRIDDLVMRVAAQKRKSNGTQGMHIGRARSIPDFGFRLGASAASVGAFSSLPVTPFVPATDADSSPDTRGSVMTPEASSPILSQKGLCLAELNFLPLSTNDTSSPVSAAKPVKREMAAPVPRPPSGPGRVRLSHELPSVASKLEDQFVSRKSSPVAPHEFHWDSNASSS